MLQIGPYELGSRLIIGSGKFSAPEQMKAAADASGSDMVTVALRRVDLANPEDHLLAVLDRQRYTLLPNTAGARNKAEAVRLAKMAAALTGEKLIKLEVTPDPRTLLPDPVDTLAATELLVADGFTVLPYMNADPILSLRLQEVGAAAVMPLGAPIGTNQGLSTRLQVEIIIEQSQVPVIVDAGLGAPSHAAEAMELGADAVLVNTAIAVAADPVQMAAAFKLGVMAGRKAYEAGLAAAGREASASSPQAGLPAADLSFLSS